MLELNGVVAGYGEQMVLHGVSLQLNPGEALAIIGPNGAGKSTMLKTISGMLRPARGTVSYGGRGIGHVLEGRALFWNLTVEENLRLGGHVVYRRDRAHYGRRLEAMYELFPTLSERSDQRAGTLSGGEQQMLAIARVLIREPELLMLDEPSLGLAPIVIQRIYEVIGQLKQSGMSLVIVEPQPQHVLDVVDRVVVLDRGRVVEDATRTEFAAQAEDLINTYLGGRRRSRQPDSVATPRG